MVPEKFKMIGSKVFPGLLLVLLSCNISPTLKKQQIPGINGRIKSLKETSYLLKNTITGPQLERRARKQLDSDDFIAYFDNKGRLKEKTYYDSRGNELKRDIFEYDSAGNCSQQKIFDHDGNLFSIIEFEYDKKGNKVSEIEMNSQKNILKRYFYSYNEQGRLSYEEVYYSTGDVAYSRSLLYNSNGNLSEEQWFSGKSVLYKKIIYKYNQENFKEEETTRLMDPNEIYTHWKYEYEYDDKGNWIERTDYLDEIPRYKLKRMIEY